MTDWSERTRQVGLMNRINPNLFWRQIRQESNFNPDAYNSRSGATGIAQIIARFHPGVDPRNPEASLQYASKWMFDLLQRYRGSWAKALAAYNWGPGNADSWNGQRGSLPAETRTYLDNILGSDWNHPDESTGGGGGDGSGGSGGGGWSLPSPDETAKWIWDTLDNIRESVKTWIVENAKALALRIGGPVVFWIVGIWLISFGLLGLTLSFIGAMMRTPQGRAATQLTGAAVNVATVGAIKGAAKGVDTVIGMSNRPAATRGRTVRYSTQRAARRAINGTVKAARSEPARLGLVAGGSVV